MVIGFDASRAFIKERTGTENYSYQLLKALAKIDKRNKYLVYIRPYHINSMAVELMCKFPKNFTFRRIKWSKFWTQGGLAVQTFKDNLDVLFVPAHTLPIIRRPNLKTVMTVHDLGTEYLPKYHRLKQQIYLKYITKYQLNSATRLIAVSKATKEDLVMRAKIDPAKVAVIYEGYDREKFKVPAKGEARQRRQSSKFKVDMVINTLKEYDLIPGGYFLFVGTVQPRKNLERLIKAFAIHLRGVNKVTPRLHLRGGAQLVIAGSKGWLADDIYKLPKRLGIEDKVKFLGYVPDKRMSALYSGAITLLFPSLFEGFGLPILEAQACGCPVLTSNVSSMPEVAGKGAVYVNPYSQEDIIRGIREIGGIRDKIVEVGFENIKGFSWEKCARETLKVITSDKLRDSSLRSE